MTEMTFIATAELEALRERAAAATGSTAPREREFNRALLESMSDGVVACDAEGALTLFNRAAREWHGADPLRLPPEEWPRQYDLYRSDGVTPLPPEDVPLARAFRGEAVVDEGMAIAVRGRPIRFVVANGGVIRDDAGRKLGAVVVMRDVTELKRVEEELRRANEALEARVGERTAQLERQYFTLRSILDGATAPIFSVDGQYRYTSFNRRHAEAMKALYGVEIALGRSVLECMTVAEDREAARRSFDRALEGETITQEAFSGDDVKSRQYLRVSHAPIRGGAGEVIGVAVFAHDLTDRKRAEEDLRESERSYRDIFDNVLDGLYLLDVLGDGRFRTIAVNPALERMTGIPRAISVGRTQEEAAPGEAGRLVNEKYQRCVEAGRPIEEELALDLPSGRRSFHSTLIPALGPDGRVRRIVGISRDVTDRRRNDAINAARLHLMQFAVTHSLDDLLEETLNEAETLSESLIGFFHFVDDDQRSLTLQNWSTRTKADFCKAEGKGRHYPLAEAGVWADCVRRRAPVIHNDYAALPHRKGMPEGHAEVVRELVVPVLRGEKIRAILGVGNKAVDYTNEDVEAVSLLADLAWEISERKRAEEALRNNERRYRMAQAIGHVGNWEYDVRTTQFWGSDEAKRIYGFEPEQVGFTTEEVERCIPERERVHQALVDLIEKGRPYDLVFEIRPRDGSSPRIIASIADVQRDAQGEPRVVMGVIQDVTERRKLEEQLRQSQKMEAIGTLAGGIAHDFNNLLTGIIGYGSLLQTSMRPDDPLLPSVEQILAASDRAAQLTRGLLAFGRKQVISLKPVDLREIVRNVERLLQRLIGEDIELSTVHAGAGDLTVMADAGQIEQVLMNLATNARDAMPGGGHLSIATQTLQVDEEFVTAHGYGKPGRYAQIAVSDTGTGMDAQAREKAFEPFFTTKEPGKGTGLGLSIVYGIVTQHGGTIDVHSEPGRGTTFKILLPLVAAANAEEKAPPLAPPARGTETILLAEDDPTVRKLIGTLLRRHGYRVVEAVDGVDALAKFSAHRAEVDMLILDVVMPRKSGREVYDAVRAERQDVRALFVSGYTDDVIHKKATLDEGLDFVSKPLMPFDLLRKVREVLDAGR